MGIYITYNGKTLEAPAEGVITLLCSGHRMLTDIVVFSTNLGVAGQVFIAGIGSGFSKVEEPIPALLYLVGTSIARADAKELAAASIEAHSISHSVGAVSPSLQDADIISLYATGKVEAIAYSDLWNVEWGYAVLVFDGYSNAFVNKALTILIKAMSGGTTYSNGNGREILGQLAEGVCFVDFSGLTNLQKQHTEDIYLRLDVDTVSTANRRNAEVAKTSATSVNVASFNAGALLWDNPIKNGNTLYIRMAHEAVQEDDILEVT